MVLIVEDGTGLAAAESYVSVADYKAYHVLRGNPAAGSDLDIERRLRLATEYIDIKWGPGVLGSLLDVDQALVFPTTYFTDPLPLPLVRACFEYAFFLVDNSLFLNTAGSTKGNITRELDKVGPLMTEIVYGSTTSSPKATKADKLMKMVSNVGAGGVIR